MTSSGGQDARRVTYEFACADFQDELEVRSFETIEELNRPYVVTIQVEARYENAELGDLLGHDAVVRVCRGHHERVFAGIVGRTRTDATGPWGSRGTVEVVPALWALRFTEQSRIYQQKTAVEIVESVLSHSLSKYGRSVDTESLARARYIARDYCVQYRESSLDFVHRLLEEEGIGYWFRQSEDAETLVLFDDNSGLTRVRTLDQAPVQFDSTRRAWAGSEPISHFALGTSLTSA